MKELILEYNPLVGYCVKAEKLYNALGISNLNYSEWIEPIISNNLLNIDYAMRVILMMGNL